MMAVVSHGTDTLGELGELAAAATTAPTAPERAIMAMEAYEYARTQVLPSLATVRREAVRRLRADGMTIAAIAEILGVTDSRISQITNA